MQPSAAAPASPKLRSFAGLLADFAAPEKKFPPARDLGGLADDVLELTYEHALRSHARYRPDAEPPALPPAESHSEPAAARRASAEAKAAANGGAVARATADGDERKVSSVTVRLTDAERQQLRQRAAEAGMTVSAYLRSCAFEVESLRAQVKQTIAELRHSGSQPVKRSLWSRVCLWKPEARTVDS